MKNKPIGIRFSFLENAILGFLRVDVFTLNIVLATYGQGETPQLQSQIKSVISQKNTDFQFHLDK